MNPFFAHMLEVPDFSAAYADFPFLGTRKYSLGYFLGVPGYCSCRSALGTPNFSLACVVFAFLGAPNFSPASLFFFQESPVPCKSFLCVLCALCAKPVF